MKHTKFSLTTAWQIRRCHNMKSAGKSPGPFQGKPGSISVIAAFFMICILACASHALSAPLTQAAPSMQPQPVSEKQAVIIYTCNTWGCLKPCST